MGNPLSRWAVNEDTDSELRYWINELLFSLGLGAVFAFATGILIAFLPKGPDNPGGAFLGEFWPYVVEVAFWLGMFVGMLWGAGKRVGSSLAGTLPWVEPREERAATGRLFGQWSAFAALVGFFAWFTPQLALAAGFEGLAGLGAGFLPLSAACWIAAGVFALVALATRLYRRPGSRRL